jgi:hypothetical protein
MDPDKANEASTNPSAISLAKAHSFIGFIWIHAHMQVVFIVCIFV